MEEIIFLQIDHRSQTIILFSQYQFYVNILNGILFSNQMSRHHIENYQSFSGISGIANHDSLTNDIGSKQQIFYTIKVNAPAEGTVNLMTSGRTRESDNGEKGHKNIAFKNPFTMDTTGYQINRDQYSDDDIREAFNVIDITKDGIITAEDIMFILKCMGQEFNAEEVQEMINLVSNNPKGVVLDDFKKIGKGKHIPCAGIRRPQESAALKQTILNQIEESGLIEEDPGDVLMLQQEKIVSQDRFEASKIHKHEQVELKEEMPLDEKTQFLRIRTKKEIMQRRAQAKGLTMLNVELIIQNVKQCGKEYLESREIADLLTINESHARSLFSNNQFFKRVLAQQVIFDSILFSSKSPLQQLDLILKHHPQRNLSFEQWLQVMVYMIGSDEKVKIEQRLKRLLRDRMVNLKNDPLFQRGFIIRVISAEVSCFNW